MSNDPPIHDDDPPLDAAFLAGMTPSRRRRPPEAEEAHRLVTEEEAQAARDDWQTALYNASWSYSLALRRLAETNPWPDGPVLGQAINTLATELWDRCFSAAEITSAFREAMADLPRYTGGDDVRP